MNRTIKEIGDKILDVISQYEPSDAVYALAKVLAATMYVTKKPGVTIEELSESLYKAVKAEMEDYRAFLKNLN